MQKSIDFVTGRYRTLALPVALLFVLIYLSPTLWNSGFPYPVETYLALSAIFSGVCCVRLSKRSNKRVIDYVKAFVMLTFALLPVVLFYIPMNTGFAWRVWETLSMPLIIAIYCYDRIIFIEEPMEKKFVVILIAQTFLIFIMLVFAFIQKSQADKAKNAVIQARAEIESQRELAVLKERKAWVEEREAWRAYTRCDSLLKIQNRK